ncbi:ADP-ribosylglycohydrolase family protein, partial [Marinitenerispora sediminis]|uniref:ADP-ribosylglycohydrolase family protein n=1 Tax=Marinitenerispora sediminis TaxID=1931232 RepID=UPI002D7979CF
MSPAASAAHVNTRESVPPRARENGSRPNGALRQDAPHFGAAADNNSKGCGGVMRSAPFGLLPFSRARGGTDSLVFTWAAEAAGLTH